MTTMTTMTQLVQRASDVLARRYAGLTLLKQGKSGLVFSARPVGKDDHSLAIKVAYPVDGSVESPVTVVHFRRECEIGAMLSHPHIVRTTPAEVLDGIEFYEMDMAGPYRLDHLVRAAKPPGYERIISIMRELADALDYAHAQGVVHGALRPSCVFLDEHGHVLVKGFLLREKQDSPHPTLAPAAVGNGAYMAPEQWRQSRVDRRVDVYAAGILAYELCTGQARVVYDMAGVPEISAIELAPNRPLRDGIPMHVNAAIRRAINKDPALRFESVGEFSNALSHPDVALAHSQPTIVPAVKAQRSSPWMLVALVLAVAALTAVAVPSAPRDKVFEMAKSMFTTSAAGIDVFKSSRPSRGTVVGVSTPRGPGTTTRASSEPQRDASRDTSPVTAEGTLGTGSGRVNPGTRETPRLNQTGVTPPQTNIPPTDRTSAIEANRSSRLDAAQTGIVRITADHGRALVVVNGIARGYAPISLAMRPGIYRIALRGTLTYDPKEMRVTVTAADTTFAEFYATNMVPPDTEPANEVLTGRIRRTW